MKVIQSIKNYIGDLRGYIRCPVTNDTLWGEDILIVPYTEYQNVTMSRKSLSKFHKESIARVILDRTSDNPNSPFKKIYYGRRFSLEEITEKIPDN